MFRPNIDWWLDLQRQRASNNTNPFGQDPDDAEDSVEYRSACAWPLFAAFRCACQVALYCQLAWCALLSVLATYGFAHFDSFAGQLRVCLTSSGASDDDEALLFAAHHPVRLAFIGAYGAAGVIVSLVTTRGSRSSLVIKVLVSLLVVVMCLISLSGIVQEIAWPLRLAAAESAGCRLDWYLLWLYRGWPWYCTTVVMWSVFIAVKFVEINYCIV